MKCNLGGTECFAWSRRETLTFFGNSMLELPDRFLESVSHRFCNVFISVVEWPWTLSLYHGTARELGPGNAIEYFCADQWTAVITPSAQLCVCSWGMFRPRARFIQELVGVVCIAIFRWGLILKGGPGAATAKGWWFGGTACSATLGHVVCDASEETGVFQVWPSAEFVEAKNATQRTDGRRTAKLGLGFSSMDNAHVRNLEAHLPSKRWHACECSPTRRWWHH